MVLIQITMYLGIPYAKTADASANHVRSTLTVNDKHVVVVSIAEAFLEGDTEAIPSTMCEVYAPIGITTNVWVEDKATDNICTQQYYFSYSWAIIFLFV